MKPADKRFWILSFFIVNTTIVLAQSIFTVEYISKEDFLFAERTSANYNIYPQRLDSISQSILINKIFTDARAKIETLDSISYYTIYEAVTDCELYRTKNLLYYPNMKLLGFQVPIDYHNNYVWWYDSVTGEFMRATYYVPDAMNTNGVYVCQVKDDCDIRMDLHFFQKEGNLFYEFMVYKNENLNGDYNIYRLEDETICPVFWHKNNTLYLRSYDYNKDSAVYIKVSLN